MEEGGSFCVHLRGPSHAQGTGGRGQGAGDRGHHNMNGRRSVVREYHVLTSDKVMLTFQIKSPATATALVGF